MDHDLVFEGMWKQAHAGLKKQTVFCEQQLLERE